MAVFWRGYILKGCMITFDKACARTGARKIIPMFNTWRVFQQRWNICCMDCSQKKTWKLQASKQSSRSWNTNDWKEGWSCSLPCQRRFHIKFYHKVVINELLPIMAFQLAKWTASDRPTSSSTTSDKTVTFRHQYPITTQLRHAAFGAWAGLHALKEPTCS